MASASAMLSKPSLESSAGSSVQGRFRDQQIANGIGVFSAIQPMQAGGSRVGLGCGGTIQCRLQLGCKIVQSGAIRPRHRRPAASCPRESFEPLFPMLPHCCRDARDPICRSRSPRCASFRCGNRRSIDPAWRGRGCRGPGPRPAPQTRMPGQCDYLFIGRSFLSQLLNQRHGARLLLRRIGGEENAFRPHQRRASLFVLRHRAWRPSSPEAPECRSIRDSPRPSQP